MNETNGAYLIVKKDNNVNSSEPFTKIPYRCYVRVTDFAVARFLYVLKHCSVGTVSNVAVSMEDNELLVSFDFY